MFVAFKIQFFRKLYNPSYLRSIWHTDPVTITPWQYLKQWKISNINLTISEITKLHLLTRLPAHLVSHRYPWSMSRLTHRLLSYSSTYSPQPSPGARDTSLQSKSFLKIIWNKENKMKVTNLRPSELSLRLRLMKSDPDSSGDAFQLQIFS